MKPIHSQLFGELHPASASNNFLKSLEVAKLSHLIDPLVELFRSFWVLSINQLTVSVLSQLLKS